MFNEQERAYFKSLLERVPKHGIFTLYLEYDDANGKLYLRLFYGHSRSNVLTEYVWNRFTNHVIFFIESFVMHWYHSGRELEGLMVCDELCCMVETLLEVRSHYEFECCVCKFYKNEIKLAQPFLIDEV